MKYKKIIAIAVVVCLLGAGAYIIHAATIISIDPEKFYPVAYVKDGDTFIVKIGRHEAAVRMLGIDTPETVDPRKPVQCYGKEASDETKSLLTGQSVRLMLNPNREEKDKYGRYLAYVYREDKMFVNKFLLENGYAHEYTFGSPYMFQKEFREVESQAKVVGKGLWGECPEVISPKSKK